LSDAQVKARARANHELYLAKIVLGGWRREAGEQAIPASTLAQAFAGAVREHLVLAYGWFLLAICQANCPPQGPPRGCDELPAMPEGKVFPGEINEFRQLESSGWLADMLCRALPDPPAPRRSDNLASAPASLPDTEQAQIWLQELATRFERMGDSLDEC
jgi:hypothetical protein